MAWYCIYKYIKQQVIMLLTFSYYMNTSYINTSRNKAKHFSLKTLATKKSFLEAQLCNIAVVGDGRAKPFFLREHFFLFWLIADIFWIVEDYLWFVCNTN